MDSGKRSTIFSIKARNNKKGDGMETSLEIGKYILQKRKQCGYTQQQVAEYLKVSCQAVSKWEKGSSYPSVIVLRGLADMLSVSVDEILSGKDNEEYDEFEYYTKSLETARYNRLREKIDTYVVHNDKRLLEATTPFAALYEPPVGGMKEPVLAFMINNAGSKLKLAIDHGCHEVAGQELVNGLINSVIVKGAKPLMIRNTIICGNIDGFTLETIAKSLSDACRENETTFIGSEVGFQPDVHADKEYILAASIVGIVDKSNIINGSMIEEGDIIIGLEGAGCKSYSILRKMIEKNPEIKKIDIGGISFMDEVMKPSPCYYKGLKDILSEDYVHGLIEMTYGMMGERYYEIIPDGLTAEIDMSKIPLNGLYKQLLKLNKVNINIFLHSFNLGIGMIMIIDSAYVHTAIKHIEKYFKCFEIGRIGKGTRKVSKINDVKIEEGEW